MGLLERWDRRNQRILEEHNRRYRAERAAGGGSGVLGVSLVGWGVGRAIGKGLGAVDPWAVGFGIALLVAAVLVGWDVRRRSRRGDGTS